MQTVTNGGIEPGQGALSHTAPPGYSPSEAAVCDGAATAVPSWIAPPPAPAGKRSVRNGFVLARQPVLASVCGAAS